MRVAIVENMAGTLHGQVGVALHEAGASTDIFRPYLGQPLPQDATQHDAIVVFGGEQSAIDDERHPYLPALAQLMHRFSEADRAVLGICLGAQLLARGLGARNLVGAAPEFGWQEVALTAAGSEDPVLAGAGAAFRTFQWHGDTFSAPPGCAHLAQSGSAPMQCFRRGRATYGMQFHFEASRPVVAAWMQQFAGWLAAHQPAFPAAHPGLADRFGPEADATGLRIARAWVARIDA